MKYRDEAESYTTGVLIMGQRYSPERDEVIGDAIAKSLKKTLHEYGMNSASPQGRVQFVAMIHLTIVPEFGMAQEGKYARIAGEVQMPILPKEERR
jgi:hypothetical protein